MAKRTPEYETNLRAKKVTGTLYTKDHKFAGYFRERKISINGRLMTQEEVMELPWFKERGFYTK